MSEKNRIKKLSSDEVSVFCEQIAIMLNGGIPAFEAIHIMYSEMEDKNTKVVFEIVDKEMSENAMLYEALAASEAFPEYMIHMVKVGETTGKLEEVMRGLSEYYERESTVMNAIRNAVAYPFVLFSIMAVILIVLVWKVLPLFEKMFDELSHDVSTTSSASLGFGLVVGRTIAIVTIVFLVIAFGILIFYKTKPGEKLIKQWLTGFKGTGKLATRMATGKFISSMSLMLAGGMNITEALDLSIDSVTHLKVKEKIKKCRDLYEDNKPFDEALREAEILTGMEAQMVTIGVKSGATDEVFSKLGKQYNDEVTAKLSKVSSTVETVLVVVLALLVGAVLLSVMVPLVSMISSIA